MSDAEQKPKDFAKGISNETLCQYFYVMFLIIATLVGLVILADIYFLWRRPGQLVSVLLRHAGEAPEHPAAFERLVPVLEESLGAVHVVEAEGTGPLAQLLDLAYLGDLVSLELALQEGLDPGPAPALGTLVP